MEEQVLYDQPFGLFCFSNKVVSLFCINPNCKQMGFLCFQQSCQCSKVHKNCKTTSLNNFLTLLNKKKNQTDPVSEKIANDIEQSIQKFIDQLSALKESIQIFGQNITLTERGYALDQALRKGTYKGISGSFLSDVYKNFHKKDNTLQTKLKIMGSQWDRIKNQAQMQVDSLFPDLKWLSFDAQKMIQVSKVCNIMKKYHKNSLNIQILNRIEKGQLLSEWSQLKLNKLSIKQFPSQLIHFTSLKNLDLGSNSIKFIPKITYLKTLQKLNLQQNKIYQIQNLHLFPKLTSLNLNRNKIFQIKNLSKVKQLRELRLRQNQIQKITNQDQIAQLQHFQLIDLSGNKLQQNQQVQKLFILKGLKQLCIANNKRLKIYELLKCEFIQKIKCDIKGYYDNSERKGYGSYY